MKNPEDFVKEKMLKEKEKMQCGMKHNYYAWEDAYNTLMNAKLHESEVNELYACIRRAKEILKNKGWNQIERDALFEKNED